MFRSVRRTSRPVSLRVDELEERCTPAALMAPIQPPIAVMIVTQMPTTLAPTGHDAAALVRTDLFGGAHADGATPEDDLLAIQEPFAAQESAFDLKPPHQSDAGPTARPAEAHQVADDAPTGTPEAEPIEMCVVVEYD